MKMTKITLIIWMKLTDLPRCLCWARRIGIAQNPNLKQRILMVCFVLFGLSILGNPIVYAQVSSELFKPLLSTQQLQDENPAQKERIRTIKSRQTTGSMTLVQINLDALRGDSTRMTLSNTKTLDFKKSDVDSQSATDFIWSGTLPGMPGKAILVIHDGNITGTIRDESDLYRVEPVGNGVHAVVKVDQSAFPPDHPPAFQEIERGSSVKPNSINLFDNNSSGPVGIDVLVAYTSAARAAVADIAAAIQLAVAEANQSYQNSRVNIRLTLVDSFPISSSYSERGKSFETIRDEFIAMTDVNSRRNNSGADMAVLIIDQPGYCGLAKTIMADASNAFAIVHYDCATGYYSFAHELGHLQGARHDPNNDPTTTPFAHGHGFQHISSTSDPSWRTIMAYNCAEGCSRLQYWSSPNINYRGIAMGTAATNDNAHVLNQTAATVAGFRIRPTLNLNSPSNIRIQ